MKVYRVYRVHYQTSKVDYVGMVVERRKGERHNNAEGMKIFAEKLYGKSSDSKIVINTGNAPPWDSFGNA